jgi:tetratricopeptide (TPR) repeat protein
MELTLDKALKKGIEAHKAGRIQEAGELYTFIIQAEPTHPDANHNLGLLSVGEGEIEEAITFFKVALAANFSEGQFWLSYMDCLMELGRSVEAQALVYQAKYKGTNGEIVDQLERRLIGQGLMVNDTNTRKVEALSSVNSNILDTVKLDKALRLAKQKSKDGQLQEVKNICTDILQKFPKNKLALAAISALASDYNSRANALMKKGSVDAAIDCCKQAIELDPNFADAYNNMGNLWVRVGDLKASINCYQQAIKINPNFAAAYNNLGLSLMDQGETELAIRSYQKAVKIKPDHADAYSNMGNALNSQGDKKAAIGSYKQAIKIKPNHAEAYNNMGNVLRNQGDTVAALVCYQQVLQINPAHAGAHNNIGLAQIDQGDTDAALISYKEAIGVDPTYAEAHHNIAIALRVGGKLEAAINSFKQAIYLNPHHTGAYNNMGNAQRDNGDLDAALDSYKQALDISPSAETHFNMGIALMEKGDLKTAMESYERAISIKPNYADAHINKAALHLRLLDFEAGWLSYEWRWKVLKDMPQFLNTSKPLWKPLMKQRVLLWGEQGLGDEIMFASLILDMHSLSSKLIVQTDQRLVDLFKRSFPDNIDFRPHNEIVSETEYDAHMPLGSAPLHFRQTIESFKGRSEGWLSACSTRAKILRSKLLCDDSEVLIGISWHTTARRNGAQNRLIPLNQIAQMLQASKVRLVSLQYGDFANEIKKLSTDYGIKVAQVNEVDNMNDIDGLAALISACDRIVSIDNTTVHLAGALGKETKVLLPHDCEWRWGQVSEDSYWYDSVQLHRQVIIGDWEHVIKNYETLEKSKPVIS